MSASHEVIRLQFILRFVHLKDVRRCAHFHIPACAFMISLVLQHMKAYPDICVTILTKQGLNVRDLDPLQLQQAHNKNTSTCSLPGGVRCNILEL